MTALSFDPQLDSKHRMLAHLGQGGTSDVYLAVAQGPIGFNKLVVLKVLKKSLQDDPEFRAMFLNEARLAARLNHPNIVQTYEIVEEAGVSTMVMEYLEGRPLSALSQRSKEGELSLAMHLRIIADALSGLHYAHELRDFDGTPLGVVHRDATPHNIFVTFEGQVKVLDFGIAKLNVSAVETRTGMIKGKARFMAREQILSRPIDRRADVYAAGVMLWQAAAGVPLWKDMAEGAIFAHVVNGEVPKPSSVRPVDPKLEAVVMKALAIEPDDRHATAAELEADIEAVLEDMGEHVTSRDVGRMVTALFSDLRESTKMLIEQQLSSSASSRSWSGVRVPESAILGSGEPSSRSFTQATASTAIATPQLRSRPVAFIAASAGVGVLLLLTAFLLRAREPAPVPATASLNAAKPAPVSPPEAPPRLRVRVVPAEATVSVDGQLLSNPVDLTLPRDSKEHVISAEASGYVTHSERLVLQRDTELALTLEPLRAPTKLRSNAVAALSPRATQPKERAVPLNVAPSAPPPKASVAVAAAAANCDKPFFIDERGIKRMLPECL
ncbi:MAG: protein kinase [Polyangiaceae bacterium]